MKASIVFSKLILLSAVSLSSSLVIKNSIIKNVIETNATAHTDNFADYAYSGSYYDSISSNDEGLDSNLRKELSKKIQPVAYPTYSGNGANHLSSLLQEADEDPTNSNNMIYFYTRDSVKKNAASSWNREHTWPQSLSNNNWGTGKAGADLLHIRPTYNTTNSTRGNRKFTDLNQSGDAKYYNGMLYGWTGSSSSFEPLDAVKGDCARIVMYVFVAYQNVYNASTPKITNVFESYDTLLKWHIEDKPDVLEGNRNDFAESSLQKNRNPFVDHPEYACKIFGSNASASVRNLCNQTYPSKDPTPSPNPDSNVESISIDNQVSSIKIGTSYTFEASVSPEDANQNVIWSSSNEEIISFDGNVAFAHKEGEATLRVTSIENSEIFAELNVIVDQVGQKNNDKNNKTIIIVCSVAGGVIVIGGLITLTIFLIRKRKIV